MAKFKRYFWKPEAVDKGKCTYSGKSATKMKFCKRDAQDVFHGHAVCIFHKRRLEANTK